MDTGGVEKALLTVALELSFINDMMALKMRLDTGLSYTGHSSTGADPVSMIDELVERQNTCRSKFATILG